MHMRILSKQSSTERRMDESGWRLHYDGSRARRSILAPTMPRRGLQAGEMEASLTFKQLGVIPPAILLRVHHDHPLKFPSRSCPHFVSISSEPSLP